MTKSVPGTLTVIATLAGVTLRRLLRGRAIWVVLLIAVLPILYATATSSFGDRGDADFESIAIVQMIVMALLPSVFVASSIGEEIEDRTTAYLWSRPIARWTIVAGKLVALAPLAAALTLAGWIGAHLIALATPPPLASTLGFAAGAVALSGAAAGVALVVPRHGMGLSLAYLVLFDQVLGNIPASLRTISMNHQVQLLAGTAPDAPNLIEPALTLAVIPAVWLAIGLLRLRRLES